MSVVLTVADGMRAMRDTICSMSWVPMVFLRCFSGSRRRLAPASSMTSMA
jgi:hypothetical protein